MLDFKSVLVFSQDPKALGDFYKKVFQKEPEWNEKEWVGFQVGTGFISFGPHDKVHGKNTAPERMILNFDNNDVKGEFERIKALGAQVIAEPYQPDEAQDMWICTFADPDGNYFQIATPWKGEM